MKRKIISMILVFAMIQSYALSTIAATTSELNNQKSDLQEKINDAKQEQKEIKEELDAQMQEISSLDYEISEAESEVNKLEAEIKEIEQSIEEKQNLIEKKQEEYEENEELLEKRLVIMYESGETTFLDMLFTSTSIIDFISNYYTVSQLIEYDAELLKEIETEKKEIEDAKSELERQQTQILELKNEKVAKSNSLKLKKADRERKAASLNAEQKQLQADIDSYNAKIKEVDSQIARILAEANSKAQSSGLKFDGSFIWPCNNKIITSTVKVRWGRWHKGIDIGARYENVYASASGLAYNLENPGGYGHYVMIVHGDGYITLYGHLDSFGVSSGSYVSQGQVIATSGNTGASTGAHLHFEIRKASSVSDYFSSNFLNPLDYLPGGYSFASGA